MTSPFDGRIAVITGAGAGIGLQVASRLAAEGATVFGFDLNEGGLAGVGTFIACDVSNEQSVTDAVSTLASHTPHVDIPVNNAGVGAVGSVVDPDHLEEVSSLIKIAFESAGGNYAAPPIPRSSPTPPLTLPRVIPA